MQSMWLVDLNTDHEYLSQLETPSRWQTSKKKMLSKQYMMKPPQSKGIRFAYEKHIRLWTIDNATR